MNRYEHIKFPEYVYQEYPKWIGNVMVQSADEEKALLGKEDEQERAKRPYNRKDK